ncbi:MAG: inositol monophosphatase [Chloroflexi bacterium]|nr:inositol monophosphatase [Chloroflexota bacterium]
MTPLPQGTSGRSAREVALEAVRTAGGMLRERFGTVLQITRKGRGNIVTDVDVQVEGMVTSLLRREFPSFGILAEESPESKGESDYQWVVDPLDGTRNYASGNPFFCTTLALAKGSELLLGLTYDPMREELFVAERGGGATLNGKPIMPTSHAELRECILGFDMGYVNSRALWLIDVVRSLWPGMESVRIMGSAALGIAYAAAGRIDIYFHHRLAPWDMAAGILLVAEAGGMVTDRHGAAATLHSDGLLATSPAAHVKFMEATRGLDWQQAP